MVRKLLACSEVAGGVLGLLLLAYVDYKTGILPTVIVLLPGLSGFIFTTAAGLMLWRDTARGRLLSLVVQAVQIPLVSTSAFGLWFQAGPQVLIGAWGQRPVAYLGFRSDYTLALPPVSEPPGFVVNLAAMGAFAWLLVDIVRHGRQEWSGALRDLTLVLLPPGLVLVLLVAWWRASHPTPWTTHPVSTPIYEAREALEQRALDEGIRRAEWHGLQVEVPDPYVLTAREPTLELLERTQATKTDNDHWPAHMAYLDLDSMSTRRFQDAASNCSLSPDRCWTEEVAGHGMQCQRSAGVPDGAVPWTPHLECQVPELKVRILVNAPPTTSDELLSLFKTSLAGSGQAGSPPH
jgi:hypothetical protein